MSDRSDALMPDPWDVTALHRAARLALRIGHARALVKITRTPAPERLAGKDIERLIRKPGLARSLRQAMNSRPRDSLNSRSTIK
jgi:hypothetical protein